VKEGAEKITQRILDDAQARADSIKAEASEKAKAVEDEARKRAERKKEELLEQAGKDAEEQKRRILGVAQLEARKELLAAKQEMIEEAFQKSLDQLTSMDEKSYLAIIREMLLNLVESGNETVIFSARDLEIISDGFWKDVNKALVDKGKEGNLKLSRESREIKGGFILQAGGVEMNCSFEALLEEKRDQLETEVANILFE